MDLNDHDQSQLIHLNVHWLHNALCTFGIYITFQNVRARLNPILCYMSHYFYGRIFYECSGWSGCCSMCE